MSNIKNVTLPNIVFQTPKSKFVLDFELFSPDIFEINWKGWIARIIHDMLHKFCLPILVPRKPICITILKVTTFFRYYYIKKEIIIR